jgi:hypothetical protein
MAAALSTLQVAADEDLFGLWFGFPNDLILARLDIQGFQPHMYFQMANTRMLWRGMYIAPTPTPTPEPTATPEPTPTAVPATPGATPARDDATPVASPMM